MGGNDSIAFPSLVFVAACSAAQTHEPPATPPEAMASSVAPQAALTSNPGARHESAPRRRVIVVVWDGLRPGSVTRDDTPRLAQLRDHDGVDFREQHAVYPTVTMVNAASLATGAYPAAHGFFGNTVYWPGPAGNTADGTPIDFSRPVFTEDHGVLTALDGYARVHSGALLHVETLVERAHAAGLKTAVIGKAGPAFIQDLREDGVHGVILDENFVFPRSFATGLQRAGFPLPKATTKYPYLDGPITLSAENGDPTATTTSAMVLLEDGITTDPRSLLGSPYLAKNRYLMGVFRDYVLERVDPALSILWFRDPDATEHNFGPGGVPVGSALREQDALLVTLLNKLTDLGRLADTDVIVMSDHGHSTVAGDPALFPLRPLKGTDPAIAGEASVRGYSVSGAVRTADLLTRAGLSHVYDGVSCVYAPGLAGTTAHGTALYPTRVDRDGKLCGKAGERYQTPSYRVPGTLPQDAIVVAQNGGSEYFYVVSHDPARIRELVTRLQERLVYGAIFVSDRYGAVPGTLSLARIRLESPATSSPPRPDVVASFDWDDTARTAMVRDVPGTEYASALNHRGMHGSSSPVDFHGTLIAAGPDFKPRFVDTYPSGNVDVAPTVAKILGFALPRADGRVLEEALVGSDVRHDVAPLVEQTTPAPLARFCRPDDPDCRRPLPKGVYRFELRETALTTADGKRYVYVDSAKATRSAQ